MFVNIGRQVREAIDQMRVGDFGQALIHALLAVAATSKRTLGRKVSDKYAFTTFLKDNIGVVTSFGLNVAQLGGLHLGNPSRPIEEVLYEVRCELVHSLALPSDVQFTDNTIGGSDTRLIPTPIINGLIATVVVASVNAREYIPPRYCFTSRGKSASVASFWGNKQKFLEWFESTRQEKSLD